MAKRKPKFLTDLYFRKKVKQPGRHSDMPAMGRWETTKRHQSSYNSRFSMQRFAWISPGNRKIRPRRHSMGLRTMNSDRPSPKPDNPRLPSHACRYGHPCAAVRDQAPQILSKREVTERVNLSKSTTDRVLIAGRFSRPIRLSANRVGWPQAEVVEWLRTGERSRT